MSTIRKQYWNFEFFQKVFFEKHKKCSYFNNFCRMWLVNEPVLTFSAPIKYAKAQFNPIIPSRVIEYTTYRHTFIHTYIHTFIHSYIHTYIHTYFFVKPFFRTPGVSKRKDLMKISKVIFHIKLIQLTDLKVFTACFLELGKALPFITCKLHKFDYTHSVTNLWYFNQISRITFEFMVFSCTWENQWS